MSKKKFQLISKVLETSKAFTFSKGNVTLSFTLNIDSKTQLTDFRDLLEEALKEVNLEIKK